MPIFEYACRQCGEKFEAIVQSSTRAECPACQSQDLAKQLSVFAVGAAGAHFGGEPAAACGTCGDPRGPGACARGDN